MYHNNTFRCYLIAFLKTALKSVCSFKSIKKIDLNCLNKQLLVSRPKDQKQSKNYHWH